MAVLLLRRRALRECYAVVLQESATSRSATKAGKLITGCGIRSLVFTSFKFAFVSCVTVSLSGELLILFIYHCSLFCEPFVLFIAVWKFCALL